MAIRYLLDTNVISETRKSRANHGVLAFLAGAETSGLFLSVLTLGEIRKAIEAKRGSDPAFATSLEVWSQNLETTFVERLLPIDAAVARRWGVLTAERNPNSVDILLAATALVHGLTLVTRNVKDFAWTRVALIDPWRL